MDVLWPNIIFLAVFAALMLSISVLRFHKSLEKPLFDWFVWPLVFKGHILPM